MRDSSRRIRLRVSPLILTYRCFASSYLSTEKTRAILPMARILLRITSLRAEAVAPGRGQRSNRLYPSSSSPPARHHIQVRSCCCLDRRANPLQQRQPVWLRLFRTFNFPVLRFGRLKEEICWSRKRDSERCFDRHVLGAWLENEDEGCKRDASTWSASRSWSLVCATTVYCCHRQLVVVKG